MEKSKISPKVSVVMPVFKHSKGKLISAIYSILNQTFKDFELIITDGSADDKNFNVISQIKDERIKYFKLKGYINCLNFGIKQAKGQYIARMDSDDISYPTRFEEQVSFLDNNPKFALCSILVEYFGETKHKISDYENDIDLFKFIKSQKFNHVAMMFRKKINVQYPDKKPVEDCFLFRELLLKGYKFKIINKILLKSYVSDKSLMRKYPNYCKITLSKINILTLAKYYNYNLSFINEIFSKKHYNQKEIIEYLNFIAFLKEKLKTQNLKYEKICFPFFKYMISKLKSKTFLLKEIKFYNIIFKYYLKYFYKLFIQVIF